MDADLRKPQTHNLVRGRRTPGLSDVLVGKTTPSEAVQQSIEGTSLAYLPSGTPVPSPADLMTDRTMRALLDGLRKYYKGPLAIGKDFMVFNVSKDEIVQRMGIGPRNPWMHTEATREGKPKYKKDQLNSDFIVDSVIPACKDAKGGVVCY